MSDAMISARMSATKKEAGNRVLATLDSNASQAVNELYDYLIAHKALPWKTEENQRPHVTKEQWLEAQNWLDSMHIDLSSEFINMTTKEARKHRLASQGLFDGLNVQEGRE